MAKAEEEKLNAFLDITENMPIREEKIKIAYSTLQKNKDYGYFSTSKFLNVWEKITFNSKTDEKFSVVSHPIQHILQDLENIETVIERLEWQNTMRKTKNLSDGRWMSYAGYDIDRFHLEIRSIFDYIAEIIMKVSDNPKNIRGEGRSFNKLKKWLAKDNGKNSQILGNDLAVLVLSADWFDDIKKVRDESVHNGGFTAVFPEGEMILFQVLKGYESLVSIPEVMYNDNVVNFEPYVVCTSVTYSLIWKILPM